MENIKHKLSSVGKVKAFAEFERLASLVPVPLYWVDVNSAILGANDLTLKVTGASCLDEIIGKTPYDLYSKKMADHIVKHNSEVIRTNTILSCEESIVDITTGEIKYFTAVKSPLHDDNGNIIGVIGASVEITAEKQEMERQKKTKVFEHLEQIARIVPVPIYWFDTDNMVLGGNEFIIRAIGGKSIYDFIGKTPYEYYPKEVADNIIKNLAEARTTGNIISKEEIIRDLTNGKVKYFDAFHAPLRDDNGDIIGTVGVSIETTAEKEAEQLKIETEAQKARIEEQERFKKIADQVSHDIRSPLASLLMITKAYENDMPESLRSVLRQASVSIGDIANHLLHQYKKDDDDDFTKKERPQPVFLSLGLLDILTEKKYQYKNLPVKFTHDFCLASNFAFIKIEPIAFRRMVSNLINNAVEALEGSDGEINLRLDLSTDIVKIIIQDNGKGMFQEVIDKIMNDIAVTHGKVDGTGIGFTQIRETIQNNEGKFTIDSKLGQGTKITLVFPRIPTPDWVAEEIHLTQGDTVVVLDDDNSIHGAWEVRFKKYEDIIQVKHFTLGDEALSFVKQSDQTKIFFLTDFELLKQEFDGIRIVEQTQISRSRVVLVSSYYANHIVRDLAIKAQIKILPKQLAQEIPVHVMANENKKRDNLAEAKIILSSSQTGQVKHMVVVDDDRFFADCLVKLINMEKNASAEFYNNPEEFLENLAKYPKDTIICIDYILNHERVNGIDLAKQLHGDGYAKLYLLSGWFFEEGEIPEFLTVIDKIDTDKIIQLIK